MIAGTPPLGAIDELNTDFSPEAYFQDDMPISPEQIKSNVTMLAAGLLGQNLTQFLEQLPVARQYQDWLDSVQSRITQCLEQVEIMKLMDEATDLYQRIWNNPDGLASGADLINEILRQLLQRLSLPAELQERVETLKANLQTEVTLDSLVQARNELAELVSTMQSRLENEVKGVAQFLKHVTTSLQELQQHLWHDDEDGENDTTHNHYRNGDTIPPSSTEETADLGQLRTHLDERLQHIQDNMDTLLTLEKQRQQPLDHAIADEGLALYISENTEGADEKVTPKNLVDPLVGIANRVAFDLRLTQEYARWKRYDGNLAVVILEIDTIDRVSTDYGLPAAHKLLKALALFLRRQVRETDLFARHGAQEFAIVLPHTTLKNAIWVAEKLRLIVESCRFHHGQIPVPITVSCGAAEFHTEDSIDSAVARAWGALQLAKDTGGNCTRSEQELSIERVTD